MTRTYERMGSPELPEWWLTEFLELLNAYDGNQTKFAQAASEIAGRKSAWGSSAVTRFKSGEARTWEFAVAGSAVLGMLPPMFVARTKEEAGDLLVASKRHDPPSTISSDIVRKAGRVAQALDGSVKEAVDQTRAVRSSDERSPRGRGHRRASRGG